MSAGADITINSSKEQTEKYKSLFKNEGQGKNVKVTK